MRLQKLLEDLTANPKQLKLLKLMRLQLMRVVQQDLLRGKVIQYMNE